MLIACNIVKVAKIDFVLDFTKDQTIDERQKN